MKKIILILSSLAILLLVFGCTQAEGNFFKDNGKEICTIEGKPVVRLYSTTWCPHCNWIGPTYEKVVNEYVAEGKIVAQHWQVDLGDDTLTKDFEGELSGVDAEVFNATSPKGSIPAFSFGCKYERIGNSFEDTNDLVSEEAELRRVIDLLLN